MSLKAGAKVQYLFNLARTSTLFFKRSSLLKDVLVNFHEKAVWHEDAVLTFNQEHFKVSRSGSPSDGQSDRDGWGSSVAGELQHPGYLTQIEVEAINFSKFLSRFCKDDLIMCKIDIEGSEYKVLRSLLSSIDIFMKAS